MSDDSLRIDTSELRRLAASFGAVPNATFPFLKQAVEVNARHVKDAWNSKLYRSGHAKRTGRSISYDVFDFDMLNRGPGVSAEVGAVKGSGKQAYITRLLELGSANNPPHGFGAAATAENQADLQAGIERALEDGRNAAGL